MDSKTKKLIPTILKNLFIWIVTLIMLVPIYLVIVNSFKPDNEAMFLTMSFPKNWTLQNFAIVIEKGDLIRTFFNSLYYSSGATVLNVLIASMASFIFARRRSQKSKILYMYLVLGLVIPINFVALMKVMQFLHFNNKGYGIILLYVAENLPFSVFLLYGFVLRIPREIDEAAILDGCRPFTMFYNVILPMLSSSIVTAGVLCFLNCWNDFVNPLYFLNSSARWPMTLAVYNFFGKYERSWNLICADVFLTCLPVVLIYLFAQKYIIGGQSSGAVKG
jgi:raffinose/stachyose/melibiose transport system permease protein